MKKLLAVIAIISLIAVPAYAKPCGCQKHAAMPEKSMKATKSRGTEISSANRKAHEAAKAEKEAIKAEPKAAK